MDSQLTGHGLVVADGGLGRALVRRLLQHSPTLSLAVTGRCRRPEPDTSELLRQAGGRLDYWPLDFGNNDDWAAMRQRLERLESPLRLVFNASGWLHSNGQGPEKRLSRVTSSGLEHSFAVNAVAPLLLAQASEAAFKRCGSGDAWLASLSARVGSIGDNRLGGWYSYRASKAAQNQLLRTVAIEWRRTLPHVCVALLHPGTVDTPLSQPFQSRVPPGKLCTPDFSAACLLQVLLGLTPQESGRFYAWDGSTVPW